MIPPHHHYHNHAHMDRIHLREVKDLLILSIIKENPIHGSEIHRLLKERYNLNIPKPIIYMILRKLEERGMIISEWDLSDRGPVRRIYRMTEEGLDYLNESVNKLKKLRHIIDDLLSKLEKSDK